MPGSQAATEWAFPNPATPPGSSAYYSVRFAPAGLRDDLAVLLGWRHLVRSVFDEVSDRGVATRKLEWWSNELERIVAGTGRHPLGLPLGRLIARAELPRQPFLDIIRGTEALLADRRVEDVAGLAALGDLDLGALCELIARVHAASAPAGLSAARRAGSYCALVELVRDSGRMLRRDRCGFLPEDRLQRNGISHTGHEPTEIRKHLSPLLADLAEDLDRHRADLSHDLPRLPATIRIRVRLADRLLAELAASDFEVADQRIALTPIRKLWNAWRESRLNRAPRGKSCF
ncbi:squalene/phytoene synthase family protein [Thiocapsa marina]|uniref:Squalene/phytoene synthase n=1 Tax=Thiocapsa marina 5811 TaxID=768671 RepID=F9UEJ9_9GAMM|nr:squalene/phytoene synthase family protein [Thiocapsa marina]EGV17320.1 Squalene/phytoene synthase [Thiocapsa marina 5811]